MTIRRISIALGLVLLVTICSAAQEVPKAEVYIGYSFVRVAPPEQVDAFNSNGGVGAIQYNLTDRIGIVGEFGGNTNGKITVGGIAAGAAFPGDQTQFSYLFGPRVSFHKTGKFTPFVHFLVGGIHNSRSFTVANSLIPPGFTPPRGVTMDIGSTTTKFRSTQNAFAMAIGGGFDINLSKTIAFRPIQLDYLPSHFSPFNFTLGSGAPAGVNDTRWQNNLRYSAGITFRFGG